MKKQLLLLIMMVLPMVAMADESGSCGENLMWTYTESTKTLTISGTGTMTDYGFLTYYDSSGASWSLSQRPWESYISEIQVIEINNGVSSIGGGAFCGCCNLQTITISNDIHYIGELAFARCRSIVSVTIPNSVTTIDRGAFEDCGELAFVSLGNGLTSICDGAFKNCRSLYSVIIPNNVTSIGNFAFYGCSGLNTISIPSSVSSIGSQAFEYCSSLSSVHISNIAEWCKIVFSGNVSNPLHYAHHLFLNNTEINDLEIPNGVNSIGNYCFVDCINFNSITIPNSVTSIGNYAFSGCTGLNSVVMPNSVHSIGNSTFQGCTGLNTIEIPNSVTSIGKRAFDGCTSLSSIVIPNSIKSISEYLFYDCQSLVSVSIPNSVTSIGEASFCRCFSLNSLSIPNSVVSIDRDAFDGCRSLKTVNIPENIKTIKIYTFYGCNSLKSITIPSKVEIIYQEAFADCGLEDVKVMAETPPFAYSNTFSNYNIPLYVPASAMSSYQATSPWSNFTSFKTLSGEDVEKKKCATPTISYKNGQLAFSCETEDVEYSSSITDADIKTYKTAIIQLGVTYNISVYATKEGYENSETATATLCWIDKEPTTEGITNDIANVPAHALLIQSNGGSINVQGADDGTSVSVYTLDGKQVGRSVSRNGSAFINTNIQPGNTAIVKIGNKSVKFVVK